MSPQEIIIMVVWLIFAGFILFSIFTRKGRNTAIKLQFGGKVIEDLGELGQSGSIFGNQTVRLLKCQRDDEVFYILETKTSQLLGVVYSFTKLDGPTIKQLAKILTSKTNIVL